jgi:1,4-dihydroxy-2-naphthoyl-CoA hydrolase
MIGRKNKLNTQLSTPTPSFTSKGVSLQQLNQLSTNTMVQHLGIEFVEIGDDFLVAKMPVDSRTHQPLGLLHGGASVALAETLGSVAATLCVDMKTQYCVGLEINANHVKSAKSGFVYGRTTPVHIGKKTQIWEIRIDNEQNELVCISRITIAVIDRK